MKRTIYLIAILSVVILAGTADAGRREQGAGGAVLSAQGEFVRPQTFIEDYIGLLDQVERQTLGRAIGAHQLDTEPLATFNELCGQSDLFLKALESEEYTEGLRQILDKPFIFTLQDTGKIYVSPRAVKFITQDYSGEKLTSLIKAMAANEAIPDASGTDHPVGYFVTISGSGQQVLAGNGQFMPVKDNYTIEGNIMSLKASRFAQGFIPYGGEQPMQANIGGWSLQKKGDANIGYVMTLTEGQIVLPLNKQLLQLIAGGNAKAADDTYPADGKLKLRIIALNDEGAVADLSGDYALYFSHGNQDFDHPTYRTYADHPSYSSIETTPEVRQQAKKLLKK